MKKTFITFIICVLFSVFLAGCGEGGCITPADTGNAAPETEEESPVEEEPENDDRKETEDIQDEEEEDEEITRPEFTVDTLYERKELDGDVVVEHEYDRINIAGVGNEFAALGESLAKVNDDIVRRESESMETDIDDVTDHDDDVRKDLIKKGYYPLRSNWKIYVRRADRVSSIAVEYRIISAEGDRVEMRGHSFMTDSGKELALSDIVDDEKAFYDILAKKTSETVTDAMRVIADDRDMELIDCREAMEECIDSDRSGWVLDPQGITFWFENINAALSNISVTVLFADDKDETVFNRTIASNVPDEWIMQIPGNYLRTCFDSDDNGTTDAVSWMLSDHTSEDGSTYPSGIDINYNGRSFLSSELIESYGGMFYGTVAMLVHKDNKTYFMTYYCEEAEPCFVTLALKDDFVEPADAKSVYIDRTESGEYIPVDPSAIRVYSDHGGDEMTVYPPEVMSVGVDGKLTVREETGETSSESQLDVD